MQELYDENDEESGGQVSETVRLDKPWSELLALVASIKKTHRNWVLYDLLGKEADAMGLPRPLYPWDLNAKTKRKRRTWAKKKQA